MNFFPNIPLVPNNPQFMNYMEQVDKMFSKINEYDTRIKKLEDRVHNLENSINNSDIHNEPDDSFYMI